MLDFRTEAMQWLHYDPDTGRITWRASPNGGRSRVQPGMDAGTLKDGYVKVWILGQQWRAHRLAWLFMTGAVPPKGQEIDHVNGNRADNRWSNLRLATRSENNMNRPVARNNKSGHPGVSWRADTSKWHARIVIGRKAVLLGDFDRLDDAVSARQAAEKQHFGAFSVLNRRME